MRGILINPWTQSVDEIEIESGLAALYAGLSGPTAPLPGDPEEIHRNPPNAAVTLIDRVDLGKSPTGGEVADLWIDDEGLLQKRQAYYQLVNSQSDEEQPTFAGRGIILGCSKDGVNQGTTIPLRMVRERVRWIPLGTKMTPREPVILSAQNFEDLAFIRKMSGL